MYKNVLVVGSEFHSSGLDFTDAGRNVSVIFGDGAGAVVVQPSTDENKRILSTHLHSDGTYAEKLAYINPGCHGAHYLQELADEYIGEPEFGGMFLTQAMIDKRNVFPNMDGQLVFKNAVVRFPEVIAEALAANNLTSADIDMLVPHQANLRISEFVRAKMGLPEEKVYNNIQYYGNTTAASIPIALCEAWEKGLVKEGDLVCLAAFGAGFTWASALIRW
jgi:3-oxoacyl-[acyl-carrier-protein] synthase-3